MRSSIQTILLLLVLLGLVGCPLVTIEQRTFTSADVSNGGGRGNGPEILEGDAAEEGEGDGGGGRTVVEPDVIRRDGNLLYVLNQFRGLSIVNLDTDTLLVQVPTLGIPKDLYFAEGVAYVLVGGSQQVEADGNSLSVSLHSRMYAVDVSTPSEAYIQGELELTGELVDSRLVGAIFYAVTVDYGYSYDADFTPRTTGPGMIVTSIDVTDPTSPEVIDRVDVAGTGYLIHVNSEAVFVVTNDWGATQTIITYLDITDAGGAIVERGQMAVRGYVGDRFKLDAWNGVLRVVSSDWREQRQVYVSTFDLRDPALPRLAERAIEGAAGETLFATRFDGARAYVVTYLIIDPLFVLDLSDPANPIVLGELEVPGYSTHIETQGDRLIALGVDDTGTNGNQVSVSVFDVSGNGAPTLVDRVSFGENWTWSSAYSDVKAFTVLDDLIIVPFSGWNGYSGGGFDRLQFVSYTADSLTLRGSVDVEGTILRSFEYETYHYGVTTERLSRIDATNLDAPEVVTSVVLAENLVDFLPVSGDLSIELIAPQEGDALRLRTVDGAQMLLGEVDIRGGYYQDAVLHEETVVVVSVNYEDQAHYVVTLVDISNPASPEVADPLILDVDPYFSYYYGFDIFRDEGFPEDGVAAKTSLPYYYSPAEDSIYRVGDQLALRCFSEAFDRTVGDGVPYQGIAMVDLRAATVGQTIGFGTEHVVSLDVVDDTLYLSSKEQAGRRIFNPMAAYYVQAIDMAGSDDGPAVNVPGAFLAYDSQNDVLALVDHQWAANGEPITSLETVAWDGGETVTPVASRRLPDYSFNFQASEGRVYYESYGDESSFQQVTVNTDGSLTLGDRIEYGPAYGNLLGVTGDHALLALGGAGAVAHYRFDEGKGSLVQLVNSTGYPSRFRVGEGAIYLPLGYYGLLTFPL